MRRKTFSAWERLVLVPVELVGTLKAAAIVVPVLFLLGGLGGPSSFWANALTYGLFAVLALMGATLAGAVLTPLLLPWLPGRAFSVKGLAPGVLAAVLLLGARFAWWEPAPGPAETAAWLLLVSAVSTYLALNFTGASTYTSLSGVKKEMRVAVPLQIAAAVVGMVLWIGSRLSV
jgi:acetyl-CoA decarbonylase/synthase complex subunit gamma